MRKVGEEEMSFSFYRSSGAEIAYVYKVECENAKMPRAMHQHENQLEIVLLVEGGGTYDIDNRRYHANKGDLIFFDAGILHDEVPGGDHAAATYCIGLKNWTLRRLGEQPMCPVLHCGVDFPLLHKFFDLLFTARCGGEKDVLEYLLQGLLLKLDDCIKKYQQPLDFDTYHLGGRIKQYIDDHYLEPLTLQQMATAIKINEYYLVHTFKEVFGYSPMQYVIRRRIGEAQTLLINTAASVTEIALQTGYNNSNYFQRVFSTMVGMSPGRYRKSWARAHAEEH
jgi:AraC-type DNA-binding domain-containing proteins